MADAIPPPAARIDAIANWAEPAKTVADMTIASTEPMPEARARTPKEMLNASAARAIGAIRFAPSR